MSRGHGHQVTIAEQAEHWATPNVPNGGRTTNTSNYREDGSKQQLMLEAQAAHWQTPGTDSFRSRSGDRKSEEGLDQQARHWPTPAARDYKGENSDAHLEVSTGSKHLDQLPNFVAHLWPTPTAEPYGSSQNGINGIGGANERPSANTPSLERLSRSFLPALMHETNGDDSSSSTPTLHQPSFWATSVSVGVPSPPPTTGKAKLNPQFVEWLMGLPLGYTDLIVSIDCGRAAMRSYRFKQRQRLSSWLAAWRFSTERLFP